MRSVLSLFYESNYRIFTYFHITLFINYFPSRNKIKVENKGKHFTEVGLKLMCMKETRTMTDARCRKK